MTITSCYRYVIELPVSTLNELLRGAVSENDTSGALLTRHWDGVPVGSYTATVDARPEDVATFPPTLVLTPVALGVAIHLAMHLEVRVVELPDLEAIAYHLEFDLPGQFVKDMAAPPRLVIRFPGVTAADLHLLVSGGQIPLTPELIEPKVHALYAANPSLGHTVKTGIAAPPPIGGTVAAEVDIYDNFPSGAHITVTVDSPTQVTLVMPGHFHLYGISTTYIDTEMTARVKLRVEQTDGLLTVFLKNAVQQADVTVTFVTSTIYDIGAKPILAGQIATKMSEFDDFVQTFPTSAEVRTLIEQRLVELSADLALPIFTPQPPSGSEVDLTNFEATTVAQSALALEIQPLGDGTPCDPPDAFARATGFAIAVAAPEVSRLMEPLVTSNTGDHHVQGHDITVTRLTAELSDPGEHGQTDGHIWIDGTAVVHVDCWSDPEIDFWGPLTLIPSLNPDGALVFTAHAGGFGADDPCCADVDPAQIAQLIEGEQSIPIVLPSNFSGVGHLNLGVDDCQISRAGLVVNGSLSLTTSSVMSAARKRRMAYWFSEMAGGG